MIQNQIHFQFECPGAFLYMWKLLPVWTKNPSTINDVHSALSSGRSTPQNIKAASNVKVRVSSRRVYYNIFNIDPIDKLRDQNGISEDLLFAFISAFALVSLIASKCLEPLTGASCSGQTSQYWRHDKTSGFQPIQFANGNVLWRRHRWSCHQQPNGNGVSFWLTNRVGVNRYGGN